MKLILLTFEEIKISTSQKLEFCKSPTNLHFIYIYITESLSHSSLLSMDTFKLAK